jgi:hypothetical protein
VAVSEGIRFSVSVLTEDCVETESKVPDARHLEEVLQSKCFERATRLRTLLLYLWENRHESISEYAIAVDGLGRNPDFESKIDATVRVQIARLRVLLRRYYEGEGSHFTARFVIPLGTHQIQLVEVIPDGEVVEGLKSNTGSHLRRDASGDVVPTDTVFSTPRGWSSSNRFLVSVLIAVIVVLLFCLSWLLLTPKRHSGKNNASMDQELPLFWKEITNNGKATRIILPTPIFFAWRPDGGPSTLIARDLSVNESTKLEDSPQLVDLEKRFGKPAAWQNYTFASDTFAALRLERFLDSYGVQTSISSSAESPHQITDYENVVAFGTTSSLIAYQSDLDRLSYKLGPYEKYVIDKRMPAGSPRQFPLDQESASRMVTPGLIALLPRQASGSRILLVQGAQTTALISYMTSETGMREIAQAEAEHGHNPFFEAVVLSEVNGENPIQSRLVAFRPFAQPGFTPAK